MECFKCEISGDEVLLFDAITSKGIVKICAKCSKEEDIPIINKPSVSRFDEYKKRTKDYHRAQTKRSVVYDRLSSMSGIKVRDGRDEKSSELVMEEKDLKKIADKNFEKKLPVQDSDQKKKSYPHLVDNFHWIIMRARRSKKLTSEQLASEIAEPESAIKMAEKGVLPEDSRKLVSKLESILGILLIREEFRKKEAKLLEKSFPKKIDLKSDETKTMTIADLKEMKNARESEIFSKPPREEGFREELVFNKEASEDKPEFIIEESKKSAEEPPESVKDKKNNEEELTDKEIDDIIFGKR